MGIQFYWFFNIISTVICPHVPQLFPSYLWRKSTHLESIFNASLTGSHLTSILKQTSNTSLSRGKKQTHAEHRSWEPAISMALIMTLYVCTPSTVKRYVRKGIPNEYRALIWMAASGSQEQMETNPGYYHSLLQAQHDPRLVETIRTGWYDP